MMADVAQRFARSAERYEHAAQVQRDVAGRFDAWLASTAASAAATTAASNAPERIVEIGCGTGFLTRRLRTRFPQAHLYCTDIAPEMVARCRLTMPLDDAMAARTTFAVCDGRDAVFAPRPDWIVSSMCFQWFDNLDAVIRHHLGQCKVLAFSLLQEGSFERWRAAHHAAHSATSLESDSAVCREPGLQALPGAGRMQSLLDGLRHEGIARRVEATRIRIEEHHADGLSFARALRAIGADAPRPAHRPANLWPVLRQLEGGFDANYEVGFYWIET